MSGLSTLAAGSGLGLGCVKTRLPSKWVECRCSDHSILELTFFIAAAAIKREELHSTRPCRVRVFAQRGSEAGLDGARRDRWFLADKATLAEAVNALMGSKPMVRHIQERAAFAKHFDIWRFYSVKRAAARPPLTIDK